MQQIRWRALLFFSILMDEACFDILSHHVFPPFTSQFFIKANTDNTLPHCLHLRLFLTSFALYLVFFLLSLPLILFFCINFPTLLSGLFCTSVCCEAVIKKHYSQGHRHIKRAVQRWINSVEWCQSFYWFPHLTVWHCLLGNEKQEKEMLQCKSNWENIYIKFFFFPKQHLFTFIYQRSLGNLYLCSHGKYSRLPELHPRLAS